MIPPPRALALSALLAWLLPELALAQQPEPQPPPARESQPALAPLPQTLPEPVTKPVPRPVSPDPASVDVWDVAIDLAASGAQGNESYLIYTSGLKIRRKHTSANEMQLEAQARYGTNEGHTIARLLRGGLRYEGSSKAIWSPFLTLSAERDLFRKLELRGQAGVGAKYALTRSPAGSASLSLALLYDHEDLATPGETRRSARVNWRFKGERKVAEGVKLENVSFYQPLWEAPTDYLASSITTVTSRMTEHVALTVAYDYERNSTPAEAVLPDDHQVNVGLKLTF